MTLEHWLSQATTRLQGADIPTARLDSLVLLEDCLATDRAQLLAHLNRPLTASQQKHLAKLLQRRVLHEPLAYIRGHTEFYGRDFIVDHRVLEPRPESETIIEVLKSLPLATGPRIVDVGTGSGALAITAQLEIPSAIVTALDIDPGCLAVAQINSQKYGLTIKLLASNLLQKYTQAADVLLCNLPYVPADFHINQAASHEPKLAIFGGADGLDLYRQLFRQLLSRPISYVLCESLPPQHMSLAEIAHQHGYALTATDDFIQLFTRQTNV